MRPRSSAGPSQWRRRSSYRCWSPGSAGPRPGDRLVDWQGAYNLYYVCDGAYGAGRALREFSPEMHTVWQKLGAGDGAVNVTQEGASGEVEVALVNRQEIRDNTNPHHPETPGHFTCEGTTPRTGASNLTGGTKLK